MKPIALITGGQQGIGLGIAERLVESGFGVALASLHDPDASEVKAALASLGQDAGYFQHDVSQIDNVSSLLDSVETDMGPITCLINNAGVGSPVRGDMLDVTPENFDFTMNINLRGAYFLTQQVSLRMLQQQMDAYRSIVFVTSVSAEMVSIERAEYCMSKAGASMMSQLFSVRLAPHGIGVFELRPGIIETSLTAAVKDKYTARIADGLVPAQRWGIPGDVGQIVLPLVKGEMQFANGAVIPVDGGLSIPRL